jgi:hypothetical protein
MNPAEEIRRASKQANLPHATVIVIDALLSHANWATGQIPAKWQPRSVDELARWAGVARSTCETALDTAEWFGWIERTRPDGLRRGASTTYQVRLGRPRPAVPRSGPLSGAERTRRWRQRLKERDEPPGT